MSTSHARHSWTEGESPTAKEVLEYLHELLGQSAFSASERNRRFLSYVVEETLQGRADRIKAYNIALAAFDRTADFDPLTDPIVRIEASRLRRSLEHYYLTAGCADRIRIAIPKGSYAATFDYQGEAANDVRGASEISLAQRSRSRSRRWPGVRWAKPAAAAIGGLACGLAVAALAFSLFVRPVDRPTGDTAMAGTPSLLILPLEDASGDPTRSFVARGLTYEISTALTQIQSLTVYASEPGFGGTPRAGAATSDFTLLGAVQGDPDSIRVAVFLMDSRTGRFLQSWSFEKDLTGRSLVGTQLEIARDIRTSLENDCAPAIAATNANAAPQATLTCRRLVALSKS